ncbi:DUF922 domain-containing protein [Pontibacter sp. KCTC 32443]|uniref:DUF922 domain-containing protein n=1 Tax=Pontibacter TaxID=323449 RepID=UPI00164E5AC2|nr:MULTISPECIES: DUF922 domain-containing protein [Pontibacter]MBC5774812.1 DUF922 domain-containing protein [Pontibacter sp. KCTC 32443]
MKRLILLFFGLVLSWSGFAQKYNTLAYEPGKKLTWQDFKGRPKPTDIHKGAEITVSIFLNVRETSFWSGRVTYDAYAVAFKDESWVRPAYRDDYSLKHEQLHFDIAHLYAETLEIKLNSLDSKTSKDQAEVEKILKNHLAEMRTFQDRYDRETHGGNNYAKQKKWANKIEKAIRILHAPA